MDHDTAPRNRSRGISFRSDKSSGSKPKIDLTESSAEKKKRTGIFASNTGTTVNTGFKANPNAAMNEVQPGTAAEFEKPTIESLRGIQHKDADGNSISEPDLSNPTRQRWERPLDTIRSFERAIDGDYKRRSMSRAGSNYEAKDTFSGGHSRRSSYYGGYDAGPSPSRYGSQVGGGGYYGGRRPDSFYDASTPLPTAPPSRNRFGQRMMGDTQPRSSSQTNGLYPQHGYHQSHDTVHTNGSDSTGPWANSTDPTSSENSSIDKINANGKSHVAQPMDGYGYDGYGPGPIAEEYGQDGGAGMYPNGGPVGGSVGYSGRPAVPMHSAQAAPPRAPIKLGGGGSTDYSSQGGSLPTMVRVESKEEKKKGGFFKRRFSKKE